MVYEYAIDPEGMNSFDRVARVLDACGPGTPRLLAQLPDGGWHKAVLNHCRRLGFGDQLLKRIEAKVVDAIKGHRFVSRGRPRSAEPWLEVAIAEHCRLPFRAIGTNSSASGLEGAVRLDDDLAAFPAWNVPTSMTVERTVEGMVGALAPLLHLARKVVIVEPHFDVGSAAFTAPIRALLREAAGKPPQLQLVQLHVMQRSDGIREYWANSCMHQLQSLVPDGVAAEFFLWHADINRGENASDRPHDRFLLTDNSGVQIGWGFDVRPGSQTTLSLLDDRTCAKIESDYSLNSRRFRPADGGPIRIKGTHR